MRVTIAMRLSDLRALEVLARVMQADGIGAREGACVSHLAGNAVHEWLRDRKAKAKERSKR